MRESKPIEAQPKEAHLRPEEVEIPQLTDSAENQAEVVLKPPTPAEKRAKRIAKKIARELTGFGNVIYGVAERRSEAISTKKVTPNKGETIIAGIRRRPGGNRKLEYFVAHRQDEGQSISMYTYSWSVGEENDSDSQRFVSNGLSGDVPYEERVGFTHEDIKKIKENISLVKGDG